MRFKVWKKINGEWKFHGEFKSAQNLSFAVYELGRRTEVEDLAIEEVKA